MKQFIVLLKKELMELYRTKKILILGAVFLFFTILSPLTAHFMPDIIEMIGQQDQDIIIIIPDPTAIDSYLQFISNFGQITVFVMIIVLAPLIVEEKRKGTFHTLLNNKVTKTNFVLAKVISQIKVVTVLYAFSVGIFLLYTMILFDQILITNWHLFFISIYLYYIFLICLINLISVVTKTNIMSITFSLLAFFGIIVFNYIPVVGKYLPSNLMNIATKVIVDNDYIKYIPINYVSSILICFALVVAAIRLCSYED